MHLSPRRALAWSFAERYANVVIGIGSTLILARLLTPAQVGIYSVCAAFTAVAAILRDFGVSEYLIQERELDRPKLRAAYGIAIAVAWTLGIGIFLSRGAMASFFEEPGVAQVLAVLALHFLLLPLSSPAFALLNREMAFKQIALLQTACNAVGAVVTLTLAWQGYGFMSLPWGPVANVATQTLLLAWLRPRDTLIWPGFAQARGVLQFGTRYMGARLIETLAKHVHEPVIAKAFGFASVGLFSRALGMIEMFHANVADAVVRVATPAFAAEHRAGRPLAAAYARATAIFVAVQWPFFGFVALAAPELIYILLGSQWTAAAPIATVLALAALPAGLVELAPQMLSATGHVRRRLQVSLWVSPLHVAGVLVASTIGLRAVAAVTLLSGLVSMALYARHLRAVLGIGAAAWWRACGGSAVVTAATLAGSAAAIFAARSVQWPAAVVLLCGGAVGFALWLTVAWRIGHPAWLEVSQLFQNRLRTRRPAS
ncbi:MAG: oligosaccharide flippase family protein [Pseudomonadota bacterium]|nr:oligosaccharide flippase family protein [Pseudomonadota bacterium]